MKKLLLALLLLPLLAHAGTLTGSGVTGASTFNLTTLGPTGWGHWSDSLTGVPNQTMSGGTSLGNITLINASTHAQITGFTDGRTFSWTNGTPTGSSSNTLGIFIQDTGSVSTGNGFSLTVPAGLSPLQLIVVTGGFKSTLQVAATLSDGSASPYSDSTFTSSTTGYQAVYTFNYAANSNGQTATFAFTVATDFGAGAGNVTMEAATLAPGTAPPAAIGTMFLVTGNAYTDELLRAS